MGARKRRKRRKKKKKDLWRDLENAPIDVGKESYSKDSASSTKAVKAKGWLDSDDEVSDGCEDPEITEALDDLYG